MNNNILEAQDAIIGNCRRLNGVADVLFRLGNVTFEKIISDNPVASINNKSYLKSCTATKATSAEKIFLPKEIDALIAEVRRRATLPKWSRYYILGYAMLFSSLTGVCVGELCAIKWADIDYQHNRIHIHAQQVYRKIDGRYKYVYEPTTKTEKGISAEGRYFPLSDEIIDLLEEIKQKQNLLEIKSGYIFCNIKDSDWIKEHTYVKFLRRICRRVGLEVTNNHALRMSLNSNVLIPLGVSVADRAYLLGHSVETNLKYYSFAQKDVVNRARSILNEKERFSTIPFPKEKAGKACKGFPDQKIPWALRDSNP